jgi:Phytochelatin synthase
MKKDGACSFKREFSSSSTSTSSSSSESTVETVSQYMGFANSPNLVWFSSKQGKDLLTRSISKHSAESYFPLSEQFLTQSGPPSCGPATLAMVLNSLNIDPGRIWKSPWRWFTEEMLQSCVPFKGDTTMQHFSLMAECNGASSQTFYASLAHEEFFRSLVKKVTSSNDQRLVVCFDRSSLGQTGVGHYSPVAAYDEDTDMVLILDVARFKYPPYWVPVKQLFESMIPMDTSTGKSRGFFVLSMTGSTVHRCAGKNCTQEVVDIEDAGDALSEELTAKESSRLLEILFDPENDRAKVLASEFVHELRIKLLKNNAEISEKFQAISHPFSSDCLSEYETIKTQISKTSVLSQCSACNGKCTRNLNMAIPGDCVNRLTSVELLRPIDYFLKSMPQHATEIAILFLQERRSLLVK